jgi:two-component system chemotaxis response regulator CheB
LTRIRVLVVDDSAFARKVIREVLGQSSSIEVVGTAHDGLDALERIAELKPDVVTLDLVMPNLDGVGVLQAIHELAAEERPRVVVVSMSGGDSDLAIAALHEGAVDVVHKPTALATDRLYELSDELLRKVEAAAAARVRPMTVDSSAKSLEPAVAPSVLPVPKHDLVLIGASTGGPQAVGSLLRVLPKDFPVPIVVVIHIPEGFSQSLAESLDRVSELTVSEAVDGMLLKPGLAVLARAGQHLTFEKAADGYHARLSLEPHGTLHRPSLDVLFTSAAKVCTGRVLGLVLTGMGNDGLEGARAVHARGGTLLTQTEASSVVYGMPRVVWEDGLATAEADIEAMPALLLRHL